MRYDRGSFKRASVGETVCNLYRLINTAFNLYFPWMLIVAFFTLKKNLDKNFCMANN